MATDKIWAIVCGNIRSEIDFYGTIYRLCIARNEGIIEGIIFSTWLNEIEKIPNLRELLTKLNVLIVENVFPNIEQQKLCSSSYLIQAIQYQTALNNVPDDSFVLKCRSDMSLNAINEILSKIKDIDLNIYEYNIFNCDLNYKVGILYPSLTALFAINDFAFIGWKKDLQKLNTIETYHNLGQTITSESSFFLGYFIHRFDIIADSFRLMDQYTFWSLIQSYDEWHSKIENMPNLLLKAYSLYFLILYSCFYCISEKKSKMDTVSVDELFLNASTHPSGFANGHLDQSIISKIVNGQIKNDLCSLKIKDTIDNFKKIKNSAHFNFNQSDYDDFDIFLKKINFNGRILKKNMYDENLSVLHIDSFDVLFGQYLNIKNSTKLKTILDEAISTNYNLVLWQHIHEIKYLSSEFYKSALFNIAKNNLYKQHDAVAIAAIWINNGISNYTSEYIFNIHSWHFNKYFTIGISTISFIVNYNLSSYFEKKNNNEFLKKFIESLNQYKIPDSISSFAEFNDFLYSCSPDSTIYDFLKQVELKYCELKLKYDFISDEEKEVYVEKYTKDISDYGTLSDFEKISQWYEKGYIVNKNLEKSEFWTRAAIKKGSTTSVNRLYDLMLKKGNNKLDDEIIKMIEFSSKNGDIGSMIRLSRSYRYGIGVSVDLDKAADLLRTIVSNGEIWASNELFDVLWNISTPESYDEMISVIKTYADLGNENAIGRLGLAYREGKGVKTDVYKSIHLFEIASKSGNKNWLNELSKTKKIMAEDRHD